MGERPNQKLGWRDGKVEEIIFSVQLEVEWSVNVVYFQWQEEEG